MGRACLTNIKTNEPSNNIQSDGENQHFKRSAAKRISYFLTRLSHFIFRGKIINQKLYA